MTDQSSPITPPDELVQQWDGHGKSRSDAAQILATQAAQWGADQELKVCVQLLDINGCPDKWLDMLRATARRPKPPSLKEQALEALNSFEGFTGSLEEVCIIRRALEALPND